MVQAYVNQGLTIESALYINFEDERLIGLHVTGFDTILESYRELFSNTPVLFFDEIQNISGWHKFAESTMAEVSYNRIRNIINSTGMQVGTTTVIEWPLIPIFNRPSGISA